MKRAALKPAATPASPPAAEPLRRVGGYTGTLRPIRYTRCGQCGAELVAVIGATVPCPRCRMRVER